MKKNMLTFFFAFIVFIIQGCSKISGEGPTVTQTYNLNNFTSVSSNIDGDVYITQGTDYKVEISAQQNILDVMQTSIVGGELRISLQNNTIVWRHQPITVRITMPVVNGMTICGSGNIRAMNAISSGPMVLKISGSGNISLAFLTGDHLDATISGSGNITVNGGNISSENLVTSGSGDINVINLAAVDAYTRISGSGNTSLSVSNSLNVSISGSGDVSYSGTPQVNTSISGSGRLRHI